MQPALAQASKVIFRCSALGFQFNCIFMKFILKRTSVMAGGGESVDSTLENGMNVRYSKLLCLTLDSASFSCPPHRVGELYSLPHRFASFSSLPRQFCKLFRLRLVFLEVSLLKSSFRRLLRLLHRFGSFSCLPHRVYLLLCLPHRSASFTYTSSCCRNIFICEQSFEETFHSLATEFP